jgi:hypothetical protein
VVVWVVVGGGWWVSVWVCGWGRGKRGAAHAAKA